MPSKSQNYGSFEAVTSNLPAAAHFPSWNQMPVDSGSKTSYLLQALGSSLSNPADRSRLVKRKPPGKNSSAASISHQALQKIKAAHLSPSSREGLLTSWGGERALGETTNSQHTYSGAKNLPSDELLLEEVRLDLCPGPADRRRPSSATSRSPTSSNKGKLWSNDAPVLQGLVRCEKLHLHVHGKPVTSSGSRPGSAPHNRSGSASPANPSYRAPLRRSVSLPTTSREQEAEKMLSEMAPEIVQRPSTPYTTGLDPRSTHAAPANQARLSSSSTTGGSILGSQVSGRSSLHRTASDGKLHRLLSAKGAELAAAQPHAASPGNDLASELLHSLSLLTRAVPSARSGLSSSASQRSSLGRSSDAASGKGDSGGKRRDAAGRGTSSRSEVSATKDRAGDGLPDPAEPMGSSVAPHGEAAETQSSASEGSEKNLASTPPAEVSQQPPSQPARDQSRGCEHPAGEASHSVALASTLMVAAPQAVPHVRPPVLHGWELLERECLGFMGDCAGMDNAWLEEDLLLYAETTILQSNASEEAVGSL